MSKEIEIKFCDKWLGVEAVRVADEGVYYWESYPHGIQYYPGEIQGIRIPNKMEEPEELDVIVVDIPMPGKYLITENERVCLLEPKEKPKKIWELSYVIPDTDNFPGNVLWHMLRKINQLVEAVNKLQEEEND